MSFGREDTAELSEKFDKSSTAASSTSRHSAGSHKSLIPKFRTHSQTSSDTISEISFNNNETLEENHNTAVKVTMGDSEKPAIAVVDDVEGATEISIKSDEFADCLDSNKTDTKSSIEEERPKTPIPEKVASKTSKKAMEPPVKATLVSPSKATIIRRNSSSGIPVCISKNTNSKTSPRPSPRVTTTASSSIPRKATISNVHIIPESRNLIACKKNYELFVTKKKRLEQLKKDVADKQKPLFELYQSLQVLKKKLDDSGRTVTLESIKIVDYEERSSNKPKHEADPTAGGENILQKVDLETPTATAMKKMVQEVPQALQSLCKELIDKRGELLIKMDQYMDPNIDKNVLKSELEVLKGETEELNNSFEKLYVENEKVITSLIEKWSILAESSDNVEDEKMKELQTKMKKQEQQLKDLTSELMKKKQQSTSNTTHLEEENCRLRDKINHLERSLLEEKRKLQNENDKFKTAESSIKTFKSRIKDYDNNKHHYESKITQLSTDLRSAQQKNKQMEKNYEKEIAELNKSRHLDKSVIERLNKDKSTFETRYQVLHEQVETTKRESAEFEENMTKELTDAKNELEVAHNEISELKNEINLLNKEVNHLEIQNQHATDIIVHKKDHGGKAKTERESELQVEVVAQRAAIRALQEKLEANTVEKLRFIKTIEQMNGSPDDSIVKSLIKKEEEITKYSQALRRNEEIMSRQKIEIDKLKSKLDHMDKQIESMTVEESNGSLKYMLNEGKTKLEQALMKSLENEHKIIKYEHELAQNHQHIANLENMMKVRDGLIGVIKAKKDELAMENNSLSKYSEEVRNYVLQSKEEMNQKNEIIQMLHSTIETKQKDSLRLEKRVQDLEEKLTMTNEKRYKLQDTITFMEKELQTTKAQISHFQDLQTRYDFGRITHSSPVQVQTQQLVGLTPWNENGATLYKQYKSAYEKEQKLRHHHSDLSPVDKKHRYLTKKPSTMGVEDTSCKGYSLVTEIPTKISSRVIPNRSQEINFSDPGDGPVKIKITVM